MEFLRSNNPKTDVDLLATRLHIKLVCHLATIEGVGPTASLHDTVGCRSVPAPFKDITAHVIKAQFIGSFAFHRLSRAGGCSSCFAGVVAKDRIGSYGIASVTSSKGLCIAGGIGSSVLPIGGGTHSRPHPFYFRGQAITIRTPVGGDGVPIGIVVGYRDFAIGQGAPVYRGSVYGYGVDGCVPFLQAQFVTERDGMVPVGLLNRI